MSRILRIVLLLIIAVLLLLGCAATVFGSQGDDKNTFVNLYKVDYNSFDSISIGLKEKLWGNIYGSLNLEPYGTNDDLKVQGGIIYLFPRNVLFFKFYGGIGAETLRDNGFNYDYILLGTHFLYFFSEMIYPWKNGVAPFYRYGLSFNY